MGIIENPEILHAKFGYLTELDGICFQAGDFTSAWSPHPVLWLVLHPGGVLGYKRDGGGGGGGGPTEPNILHPKKYMDLILCIQKNK